MDVGGRTVELAEAEFAVRGRGYIKSVSDLEQIVIKNDRGVPLLLKDVARIELTPDERRGITEMNGDGEVVSGIALQRFGENALAVIRNVKDRLAEIAPSLPQGVTIEPVYDRSDLIYHAIATLKRTLIEESLIVALVCLIFLLHVRSALVAIITLPLGILIAYLCMYALGLSSNIMSLGGIAIAIGAMVDAAIVMIENAHKRLERAEPGKTRSEVIIEAAIQVGPALFFSLLIITVSFLPIFSLEAQEGRLFKPLAYTKTFAMAGAALLSVTLVPALMAVFVRGRIVAERRNPVNQFLIWIYRPVIRLALRFKAATILAALAVLIVSLWPALRLGTEFMPNLNEGTLFYMPTTLPGLSVTKAAELVQTQDKIIKSFPEVASVWGKAGRAATATDPAPLEMFETVINLKPESEWRPGMTIDKLIAEMDRSLQFPGVSNAWTMPIKARIDMLSTGIRTPVGVKVLGTDLAEMEKLARQIEAVIRTVPGTTSAYAERVIGGYYLNVDPDRAQLARYGLMVGDLQNLIAMALGAEPVTTTVEGRERYTVSIRYPRDYRSDPQAIATEVLIPIAFRGELSEYQGETYEALITRIGEGVTGHVAETGVTWYAPDANNDPYAVLIQGTPDLDESLLGVPMRYGDRVVGVLVLSKLGIDQFDDEDIRLLEALAASAAVAFENARLLQMEHEAAEVARALLELSQHLTRARDTKDVFSRALAAIPSMLDCAEVSAAAWSSKNARSPPARRQPKAASMSSRCSARWVARREFIGLSGSPGHIRSGGMSATLRSVSGRSVTCSSLHCGGSRTGWERS